MNFTFQTASSVTDAIKSSGKYIGGGTNLIDLIKENVERPSHLIHVGQLKLSDIKASPDGAILGATATNADVAHSAEIERYYPLLSAAILAGASPQLRNMATTAGNLLQRTRCYYFYDTAMPCNKREPGSGCAALTGLNRIHAILGASIDCVAVHPSDMCVALRALNAEIKVISNNGERTIKMKDFHRLPESSPEIDHNLMAGELITKVTLPPAIFQQNHAYVKVRDRASYSFALVSAAVGLQISKGKISHCAVALGGVAHKPWREEEKEKILIGEKPSDKLFKEFAQKLLMNAEGLEHNSYKIPLAQNVIVRALQEAVERKSV